HPAVEVIGVAQDFTRSLRLPPMVRDQRRLFFYPGSSIGNFGPAEAADFLARVHAKAAGGHLMIGVDLVKDSAELVAAYDDALGVTAAFNLNALRQVNRLAGTDFDVANWRHVALFDSAASRVEMHLEARRRLVVRWPGGERRFEAGERIHTENSYKYTLNGLRRLLEHADFRDVRTFTDERSRFAVAVASA
ncbi:MAG: L-histidine N(alpha)-methyltransferase, partial [Burkholderiaceae bacterium]